MRVVFLCLLSGSLTALCYPKPGLCLLGWVSLAPLFGVWFRATSWKQAFAAGLLAGAAFHGVALHWIYPTCRFAGIAPGLAALSLAALALFMGLNWGLIGALGRWLAPQRSLLRPWVWAAAWTAVSAATSWWTPRLAADLMAYTQYRHLALLQVGALAGPHALGFLVLAFNAIALEAWDEEGRSAANMAAALALMLGVWCYGEYALARRRTLPGPAARVELLQPAIDQYRKWDDSFERQIADTYEALLASPRTEVPDLVVWPEAALPWIVEEGKDIPLVSAWARRLGRPQLVGAVTEGKDGSRRCSALLVGPDGRVAAAYDKRELVPFGEYVPLGFLRSFVGYLNQLGNMVPGEARQALLQTPLGRTAVGICYEAAFPRWSRLDVSRGGRVIVNVTNDGWYKDTWGPHQHFYTNVFRAIENRVTVVRCGNTGISAVIDPWGVVTASLALGERGRLDADVPLAWPEEPSPYVRHGDWFAALALAAILAAAALRASGR